MSNTVKVEYVGKKEAEADNTYGTGLKWVGLGDVQDVPADKWALMKKHTDVWREAATTTIAKRPDGKLDVIAVTPSGEDGLGAVVDVSVVEDTDPALAEANTKIAATLADLDNMTDEAVRKFAASLQHAPHHKLKSANLRADVRKALVA